MTRTELSQKICEGISAVFGRNVQNPENWLYEQDYARGHVSITESAMSARDATCICKRLEEAIGHGVHVTSTMRASEAYSFTILFGDAKNESMYTDGKNTIMSGEKDGKKFITDGKDVIPTDDPDKLVNDLNKVTGSRFRKTEEIICDRVKEANLALTGTGASMTYDNNAIRVHGVKDHVIAPICSFIPEGDEYFGSGIESGEQDCIVLVIPAEVLGVEEILNFIDNAASSLVDASEEPEPKTDAEWSDAISAAEPDPAMARRFSFLKDSDGLSLALSDEKFAQAVASVRDVYGNDKAEAVLTLRLGARMARSIVERLGTVKAPKSESIFVGARGVQTIISRNMVTK